MEVGCVDHVLALSRLHVVLESSEVLLAELGLSGSLETLVQGWALALVVLGVDGGASRLGERLAEEVLTLDLGHIALVAWDVLGLQVLSGTTEPVVTFLGVVSISNVCALLVNLGWLGVVLTRSIGRLANGHIDIVVAWLATSSHDDTIDVTSSATVHLVLLGGVTSVAWQVLLLVVYLCHSFGSGTSATTVTN